MTIIPYVNNLKDLKTNYSNRFINTNQTSHGECMLIMTIPTRSLH